MKTWIWVLLILACVVSLGAYASLSRGVAVETAVARRGEIREFIDEQAQTRLPQTHLITMPYDGRIEAIELVEGEQVTAGQTVARVVPNDLQMDLDAATAAVDRLQASISENDDVTVEGTLLQQTLNFVESMTHTVHAAAERVRAGKARLEYADKNLHRVRTLRETDASTEDALNQAEVSKVEGDVNYQQDLLVQKALESMQAATVLTPTAVRQYISRKSLARAVLEKEWAQADANLRQAQQNQRRGVMTSPIDGVILERHESNERRLPSGTVLLTIGRLEDLEVEADVLSQDVVDVKPDSPVDVYGPAIGRQPAKAKVVKVYPAGFTKTSSLGVEQQRVKVVLRFLQGELERVHKDHDLGVGYRVRVKIYTARKDKALLVPRSALFRGAAGDWQLFVVREGRAKLQPIQVGLMNDEQAEVTQGIAADDVVVLAPETSLTDGVKIKRIESSSESASFER